MTNVMDEQDSETIAEFSDWVVVLEDGSVAMEGTPREIFGQVEAMERMGLAVPQVSQFGELHNRLWKTEYRFVRLDEAHAALSEQLQDTDKRDIQRG